MGAVAERIKSIAAERQRQQKTRSIVVVVFYGGENATHNGEQKNATTQNPVKHMTPGGPKQALKVSDSDSARRGVHFAQKSAPGDAYRPSCGKLRFTLKNRYNRKRN